LKRSNNDQPVTTGKKSDQATVKAVTVGHLFSTMQTLTNARHTTMR
jgi:hypothetical protein